QLQNVNEVEEFITRNVTEVFDKQAPIVCKKFESYEKKITMDECRFGETDKN
ncbi:hypothetical protein J6590_100682, partial [Homalodisca vitripennis]